MALPSASLGGLASLNIPSSVPTVVVPGKEDFWKKALVGMLVNAAGTAVQTGVKNSMSQDYAAQYGETPKTGWEKAWSGPAVNEAEHGRRQDLAGKIGLIELADKPGAREQTMKSEAELDRLNKNSAHYQDQRIRMMEGRRADERAAASEAGANRRHTETITATRELDQTRADREADLKAALLKEQNLKIEQMQQNIEMMKKALGGDKPASADPTSTGRDSQRPTGQQLKQAVIETAKERPFAATTLLGGPLAGPAVTLMPFLDSLLTKNGGSSGTPDTAPATTAPVTSTTPRDRLSQLTSSFAPEAQPTPEVLDAFDRLIRTNPANYAEVASARGAQDTYSQYVDALKERAQRADSINREYLLKQIAEIERAKNFRF